METKNKRNSSVELLRIFSMFLIVAYHAVPQISSRLSGGNIPADTTNILLGSWGILGVDIFVIISAWFLCGRQLKASRLINVTLTVFVWYVIYFIEQFVIFFRKERSLAVAAKNCIRCLLDDFFNPFWAKCFWFVTAYFFMLLLSPFLNAILSKDRKTVKKILIFTAFIPIYSQFANSPVCDIVYFLYVFLLTGYIKLYLGQILEKFSKVYFAAAVTFIIALSRFAIPYLSGSWLKRTVCTVITNTVGSVNRHSVIILLDALLIFGTAVYSKPFYSKIINGISARMFGVYLFHENKSVLMLPGNIALITEFAINRDLLSYNRFYPFSLALLVLTVMLLGTAADFIIDKCAVIPLSNIINKKLSKKLKTFEAYVNNTE